MSALGPAPGGSERGQPFETRQALERWLAGNHAECSELWVRLYKKESGRASVTWQDCVLAALAWGWIDGAKRKLDEQSWLQRLTPRRPGSNWSAKNCGHAEALMAEGRMQPAGLAQVEAAKAAGRWGSAYAGQAEMVMPADFMAALEADGAAKAGFAAQPRSVQFRIYYRLTTAKQAETRARRLADFLRKLAAGEEIT